MLGDFEKFPLVEEYLLAIAEGQLYTASFEAVDTGAKNRFTTGMLKMEIGNPFHRPITSGNTFPVVSGNYTDIDG